MYVSFSKLWIFSSEKQYYEDKWYRKPSAVEFPALDAADGASQAAVSGHNGQVIHSSWSVLQCLSYLLDNSHNSDSTWQISIFVTLWLQYTVCNYYFTCNYVLR